VHCRAEAGEAGAGEMAGEDVKRVIDDIAARYHPILVLTGGEPLYRDDLFDIAAHAKGKGLVIALATNGTLIDESVAGRIKDAGFDRVSISLDGGCAATHDGFRGIPGSFDDAMRGAELLVRQGVPFQFNTTITRRNVAELPSILKLAEERGAKALHVFILVPVGCGVEIAESDMLSGAQCEDALEWLYERAAKRALNSRRPARRSITGYCASARNRGADTLL
jgi:MoaA/NifB/PqqE/SkfB family radical SAM enzyme